MLTDSELVCVAVAQAMLGFASEAHWLRYARTHLTGLFPYLPQQSGYNKRLRATLGLVKRVIRMLAKSSDFWLDDRCSRRVRQLIESVDGTLKGQLDLEDHGGRSGAGVAIRVTQRILAMAAAIWHNNLTGAPTSPDR